ncbi:hypothetical protein D5H75_16380 [Bailinhaonella thermotolerans]|uniref:Uncharacterized protein n=2 Tax=Bailinhaonella thermotolerans TaxID=1070861 RepID=A0A3A4AS41_9ACTN|nr:hypothetical protein D5H75_16380 [Bailinhaonella thermotolerans]
MRKAYGPEAGAYGSLKATKAGEQAMAAAKLDKPHCREIGHLDKDSPAVKKAPSAVVVHSSGLVSVTEALVSLPADQAGKPAVAAMPADCARYSARVGDKTYQYATQPVSVSAHGEAAQAFLTDAGFGGKTAMQLGAVTMRYGNVVMNLFVAGRTVAKRDLDAIVEQAYARLTKTLK